MAKAPCSQCRGPRLDAWLGNYIVHATTKAWYSQMKNTYIFKYFLKTFSKRLKKKSLFKGLPIIHTSFFITALLIYVTYYKIHPFKAYNSVVFSMFTKLYNNLISEHTHHLKNRYPFKKQRRYPKDCLSNSLGRTVRHN